jgi:alcohol dehydrogenase class IV
VEAQPLDAEARQFSGFKDYYQFAHPTRVVAGRGMIETAGFEFAKEGATRPLIVTDQVIHGTGLIDKVEEGVSGGGLEVAGVFDQVPQDSSVEAVEACAQAAKSAGADSFLAAGGGSVMDTTKVANAVFSHGGGVLDYEGLYTLPRGGDGLGAPLPVSPLACIPTTAGTGSEVSMGAVIKDPEQEIKVLIGDFPLFPRLALLDPESTRTLPRPIAAATGMDAMTHAIEAYTGPEWSPHGEAFCLQALRMIRDYLPVAVEDTSNEEARGNMLIAACLAIVPGAAGTSALGAVHSMSHPAGAQYGVPHGVANAINLPHVIRFNAAGGSDIADRYRDVNELLGIEVGGSDSDVGDALASHVSGLVGRLGLPTRLSEVGVPEDGIPALVEGAMGDGTTLMNPREPSEEDYERLFREAL